MIKVGDKVRILKMDEWFKKYFNFDQEYEVRTTVIGTLHLLSSHPSPLQCLLVNEPGCEFEVVTAKDAPIEPLEERSEHERLMAFFKASAHDKNAKW